MVLTDCVYSHPDIRRLCVAHKVGSAVSLPRPGPFYVRHAFWVRSSLNKNYMVELHSRAANQIMDWELDLLPGHTDTESLREWVDFVRVGAEKKTSWPLNRCSSFWIKFIRNCTCHGIHCPEGVVIGIFRYSHG